MKLSINTFKGVVPKIDARLLPVEVATEAENCRFDSGNLEPYFLNGDIEPLPISNVKSLFRYADSHWFAWPFDVDAVRSPINQDDYERVYFTGDGVPKVTYNTIATNDAIKPSVSFNLGVPAPTEGVGLNQLPIPVSDDDFSDDESRFYRYTYITELGEEGAGSPVSAEVTVYNPDTDTVGMFFPSAIPSGHNITHIRLYRSVTQINDADFYHVADIPIASKNETFTDNVLDNALGTSLISANFDMPPSDMQGLVSLPGAFMAGFSGNSLCFSEANQPHAWPFDYRHTTEHDIVGLAVFGNSVFVATKGKPYVFSGITPDSMSGQKLEVNQACVSKRSIVDMGEYILYASAEGLVAVSSGNITILTKDIVRKAQWQSYQPETIHAYQFEGKYLAFYGGVAGFVFDPQTASLVDITDYADAGFNILNQDALYLSVNDNLVLWNSEPERKTLRWKKRFELRKRILPRACLVECDGDFTFRLWVDGTPKLTLTNPVKQTFRLPSVRGEYFEIEVQSQHAIKRIELASTLREL